MISTYLQRIKQQGLTSEAIVEGSLERLAPVLMTGLTTGIALLPLVIGGDQPGKEMLLPVATVILGGLVTATLCEFLLRPGLFWIFASDPHVANSVKQRPARAELEQVGSANRAEFSHEGVETPAATEPR